MRLGVARRCCARGRAKHPPATSAISPHAGPQALAALSTQHALSDDRQRGQRPARVPPLAGDVVLLVDATGVGRPVVDMFDQAGLEPKAITITGGDTVTQDGREIRAPKRDLAMAVQVLLQNRRLTFAAALPLLDVLTTELQNFEVKITTTAHDTYEAWREGIHDDLVLAVALACWYREWRDPFTSYGFCYSYDPRLPRHSDAQDRRAWVRQLDTKQGRH
jgi:hypothetical protein